MSVTHYVLACHSLGKFGLDIAVISGDDDSVCATIGTQDWIWDLGYRTDGKKWQVHQDVSLSPHMCISNHTSCDGFWCTFDMAHQEYKVDGQPGGYITKWKNTKMALATVHNAGNPLAHAHKYIMKTKQNKTLEWIEKVTVVLFPSYTMKYMQKDEYPEKCICKLNVESPCESTRPWGAHLPACCCLLPLAKLLERRTHQLMA